MQDFKPGTEVVHHHGKQTEPQAVTNFLAELHDFNKLLSGKDSAVSHNLAHYNFKKLDNELHHSHKGTPAELDAHMHASAVYKIDGKMQLVFTDDLYNKNDKTNKSKDHTQHAYTIDEATGKISAVFDITHNKKTGEKILMRHQENGEFQTTLEKSKSGETTVLHAQDYTEYHNPDGRVIKKVGAGDALPVIQNANGSTETFTKGDSQHVWHNVQNEKGQYERQGAPFSTVTVSNDGSVTTNRTTKDFSTTTFPDGSRVERNGTDGGGNLLRTRDAKGMETRFTWGEDTNHPESIKYTDHAAMNSAQTMDLHRVTAGFKSDNIYQSYDEQSKTTHYWKVDVNKTNGKVDYQHVSDKELEEQRIAPQPDYSRYGYE